MCVQVGCGAVSVDLLAIVAAYPKPDEKIRTTSFKVFSVFFSSNLVMIINTYSISFFFGVEYVCCLCRFKEVAIQAMP